LLQLIALEQANVSLLRDRENQIAKLKNDSMAEVLVLEEKVSSLETELRWAKKQIEHKNECLRDQ